MPRQPKIENSEFLRLLAWNPHASNEKLAEISGLSVETVRKRIHALRTGESLCFKIDHKEAGLPVRVLFKVVSRPDTDIDQLAGWIRDEIHEEGHREAKLLLEKIFYPHGGEASLLVLASIDTKQTLRQTTARLHGHESVESATAILVDGDD